MTIQIFINTFVFLYGLVIGSFLNVCIYRLPKKEGIVMTRSHCMKCGHKLQWFELIPVFSYVVLRGRCRQCKDKISIQYPLVELLNAIGYVWIFLNNGVNVESIVYCLFTSVLIVVSFIDAKTLEIPIGCNYIIALLGGLHIIMDLEHWKSYVIGAVCVSGFLLILYVITKGQGIGGGDIKLMATCGLLLGASKIVVAFMLGCILAAVIHLIRMKVSDAGRQLAFGPYLCTGVWIALLYGNQMIQWYLSTL